MRNLMEHTKTLQQQSEQAHHTGSDTAAIAEQLNTTTEDVTSIVALIQAIPEQTHMLALKYCTLSKQPAPVMRVKLQCGRIN